MVGIIISPMGRRVIRGLVLLAGILEVLCPQPAGAFPSLCKEGRLPSPFPTFAEEIRELNAGQPITGFVVGDLQLEGDVHDSATLRSRILRELQKCQFETESDLLTYGADIGIRGFFQDHGYFDAEVSVEARPLDIRNNQQRMFLIAHVKEGDQFRLEQLAVIPANPDSHKLNLRVSYLRSLISLHGGDIMSASEVRNGVQRISDAYGRYGFIDVTVEPSFDIDHATRAISITLKITEGRPYWIKEMKVIGLNRDDEASLRRLIEPGDLFNQSLIDQAIRRVRPGIPLGTRSRGVLLIIRDREKGSVKVIFDFRNPPTWTN